MVEELQVRIGADASDLVSETRRASQAFDRLADSVEASTRGVRTSSDRARDAFGRFTSATENAADGVSRASKQARDDFGRFVGAADEGASKGKRAASAFDRLAAAAKAAGSRVRGLVQRMSELGVKALVAGFQGFARILSTVTKAAVGFGVALAGIGTAAAVSFARFQNKFAQVRTLVDESRVDVANLEDGVRRLSRVFGVDVLEATESAYQAISAGQDPATVLQFLEASFKGAAAGAATTAEAVDLFTTVLNAFGASAGDTAHVADVLFATIKAGKTTASELAASIGQVAPVAASAGVSLEETSAALATLTASGLNTAEASTALKATLVGILKPAEEAGRAFARIGVSAESLRDSGLNDVITKVREEVEKGNVALTDFFPNVRALVGVATLAGEGFAKFQDSLVATQGAAGAASEAFAKVATSTSFAFGQVRRTIEDTFRQIGKVIDPFVSRALGAFAKFAANARSEIELLGNVLLRKLLPASEDAFGSLERSAERSGDLASSALRVIADGFDSLAEKVRASRNVIAGVVTAFETLGDAIKVVGLSIKTGFTVVLTAAGVAMTGFIAAAEAVAKALDLDVAESLTEARRAATEFTKALGRDVVASAKDTADALADLGDVGATFDGAAEAAEGFAASTTRAAEGARRLADEVDQERVAKFATDALFASNSIKLFGDDSAAAADGQGKLKSELDGTTQALVRFENEATASKTTTELLNEVLKRAEIAAGGLGATAAAAGMGLGALGGASGGAAGAVAGLATEAEDLTESLRSAGTAATQAGADASAAALTGFRALGGAAQAASQGVTKIGGALQDLQEQERLTREGLVLITNVLQGDFQQAGDQAARALDGTLEGARAFRAEIERLTQAQQAAVLGIGELLTPLSRLGAGFKSLATLAGEARAAIGTRLREGFDQFRESVRGTAQEQEALIDKILELGRTQGELSGLNDQAALAYEKLIEKNAELAQEVVGLSGRVGADLRPQLDALLEAFAKGVIGAEGLRAGLEKIDRASRKLVEVPLQEYFPRFVNGLKQVGDAAGQAAEGVNRLTRAEEDAIRRTEQLRREAARLQSFGFDSGRRPGGDSQAEVNQRLAGLSFGIPSTGRTIGRTTIGAGVFASGGPVLNTGRADVEAGEFVLSQRGLSDLGRLFAALINSGKGESVVNQTNNFNVQGVSPPGLGSDLVNELAFKLRPALEHQGRLAASRSPVT